jgi:hypothetical protein
VTSSDVPEIEHDFLKVDVRFFFLRPHAEPMVPLDPRDEAGGAAAAKSL